MPHSIARGKRILITSHNLFYGSQFSDQGIATSEALKSHRKRKHGWAHPSALTIASGSFSHDEAYPRFQKSAAGFAQSPFVAMVFLTSGISDSAWAKKVLKKCLQHITPYGVMMIWID
jgi:hypothetical protein